MSTREKHLTTTELESFAHEARPDSDLARRVISHLLTGCSRCQSLLLSQLRGLTPEDEFFNVFNELVIDSLFQRGNVLAAERQARAERVQAIQLWGELKRMNPNQQRLAIEHRRQFHTLGLVRYILDQGKAEITGDRDKALEAFRVAGEILDKVEAPITIKTDCRIELSIHKANAYRLGDKFWSAREYLQSAYSHLYDGTGAIDLLADLLSIDGVLHSDLGRFEDAVRLMGRAERIYRKDLEDTHEAGRVRIGQSGVYRYFDPRKGLHSAISGLQMVDDTDSYLAGWGHYSIIDNLIELGDLSRALQEHMRYKTSLSSIRSRKFQTYFQWLNARLDAHLWRSNGRPFLLDSAITSYNDLFQTMISRDMRKDLAMAQVEYVSLMSHAGELQGVIPLLTDSISWYQANGLRIDLLAALIQLLDIVRKGILEGIVEQDTLSKIRYLFARGWNIIEDHGGNSGNSGTI